MFASWCRQGVTGTILEALSYLAAQLECDGYYAREYAKHPGENWAVHLGEQLMGLSGANLWTFAHSAPLRAVVLARALREAMRRGRNVGDPGSHQEEFSERLRMIDTEVLPLARARLREIATKSKSLDLAEVETLEGPLLRLGTRDPGTRVPTSPTTHAPISASPAPSWPA